jgi:hypothetical protein
MLPSIERSCLSHTVQYSTASEKKGFSGLLRRSGFGVEKIRDWLSGLQWFCPGPALRAVSGHGGIASDHSLVFIMPVAMCFLLRNGALVHIVALLTDRSGGRLSGWYLWAVVATCSAPSLVITMF